MAWDFFAHVRILELLYHKMQLPVLEQYQLTQIELDVLLFLSHHPQQDTAKDIVDNKKLIHLVLLPDAMPAVQAGQAQQKAFFQTLKQGFDPQEVQVLNALLTRISENAREAYNQL